MAWGLTLVLLACSSGDDPEIDAEPEDDTGSVIVDVGPDVPETVLVPDIADTGPELPEAVCGDGTCEGTETKKSCPEDCDVSCQGKCGQFNLKWPCQCDTECDDYDECCEDWDQICDLEPKCGNDVCEVTENTKNCPEDCPPECGNGDCEKTEDADSCPSDCGTSCEPKCFVPFDPEAPCQCDAACLANDNCCEDYTVHCVVCGNDDCETGETKQNCPEDCGYPPNPIKICMETHCGEALGACQADAECEVIAECVLDCEEDTSCVVGCPAGASTPAENLADTLITCAVQADCPNAKPKCGNDKCEAGENPVNCPADCSAPGPSCVGHCGGQAPTGCYCDDGCKNFGDCCVDYEAVCLGGSCGNNSCEPWETLSSCAADCATGPLGCVVTNCEVGTCTDVAQCQTILECISQCGGQACADACMQGAPAPAKALLTQIASCAIENQCSAEGSSPP